MASFAQAAKSLLLKEFVGAFFLSMRQFFAPKATLNYPHEKVPFRHVSVASTRCAVIPTVKNAALPASSAKRSARRRQSPLRRVHAAMTARAALCVTTSIW